jgi:hypothetical protein
VETQLIFRDYPFVGFHLFSILMLLDGCRGTLYEPSSPGDTNIGNKIKEQINKTGKSASAGHVPSVSPCPEEVCGEIMKLANFSLVKMKSMMVINLHPPERLCALNTSHRFPITSLHKH